MAKEYAASPPPEIEEGTLIGEIVISNPKDAAVATHFKTKLQESISKGGIHTVKVARVDQRGESRLFLVYGGRDLDQKTFESLKGPLGTHVTRIADYANKKNLFSDVSIVYSSLSQGPANVDYGSLALFLDSTQAYLLQQEQVLSERVKKADDREAALNDLEKEVSTLMDEHKQPVEKEAVIPAGYVSGEAYAAAQEEARLAKEALTALQTQINNAPKPILPKIRPAAQLQRREMSPLEAMVENLESASKQVVDLAVYASHAQFQNEVTSQIRSDLGKSSLLVAYAAQQKGDILDVALDKNSPSSKALAEVYASLHPKEYKEFVEAKEEADSARFALMKIGTSSRLAKSIDLLKTQEEEAGKIVSTYAAAQEKEVDEVVSMIQEAKNAFEEYNGEKLLAEERHWKKMKLPVVATLDSLDGDDSTSRLRVQLPLDLDNGVVAQATQDFVAQIEDRVRAVAGKDAVLRDLASYREAEHRPGILLGEIDLPRGSDTSRIAYSLVEDLAGGLAKTSLGSHTSGTEIYFHQQGLYGSVSPVGSQSPQNEVSTVKALHSNLLGSFKPWEVEIWNQLVSYAQDNDGVIPAATYAEIFKEAHPHGDDLSVGSLSAQRSTLMQRFRRELNAEMVGKGPQTGYKVPASA